MKSIIVIGIFYHLFDKILCYCSKCVYID